MISQRGVQKEEGLRVCDAVPPTAFLSVVMIAMLFNYLICCDAPNEEGLSFATLYTTERDTHISFAIVFSVVLVARSVS